MVDGFFVTLRNLPAVKVLVSFGESMISGQDFILDSGFSGDVKVDVQTAQELGIPIDALSTTFIYNANGEHIPVGFAHGFAEMEGKKRPVNIIVADGPHLVGMGFLSAFGYRAIIDAKNWECHLEFAP